MSTDGTSKAPNTPAQIFDRFLEDLSWAHPNRGGVSISYDDAQILAAWWRGEESRSRKRKAKAAKVRAKLDAARTRITSLEAQVASGVSEESRESLIALSGALAMLIPKARRALTTRELLNMVDDAVVEANEAYRARSAVGAVRDAVARLREMRARNGDVRFGADAVCDAVDAALASQGAAESDLASTPESAGLPPVCPVCHYEGWLGWKPVTEPRPCPTCHYSGWYGARVHDPENGSPHQHCACGRECSACRAGDGFQRAAGVGRATP